MIKDALGREIIEGCVVLRAKHSSFTYHKVLGFTSNSIILSCNKVTTQRRDWWASRESGTEVMRDHTFTRDSVKEEEISLHNDKFYFNRRYSSNGLIVAI